VMNVDAEGLSGNSQLQADAPEGASASAHDIVAGIYYDSSKSPDDEKCFTNRKRFENGCTIFNFSLQECGKPELRDRMSYAVNKKIPYDEIVICLKMTDNEGDSYWSDEPVRVYDRMNFENFKTVRKVVARSVNKFLKRLAEVKETEQEIEADEIVPMKTEDDAPEGSPSVAVAKEGDSKAYADALRGPPRKGEPGWYSWADVSEISDEERDLKDRILKLALSTKAHGEKASEDVIIPANLELQCPTLFQAMTMAALRTGSKLLPDKGCLITTKHGAALKGDCTGCDDEVKLSIAVTAQLSRSLIEMFNAAEYLNSTPKLGMHFAAKQFMTVMGTQTVEKAEKRVLDSLLGSDEHLDHLVVERFKKIFSDSQSPNRLTTSIAILLRRLAKDALGKGESTKLRQILIELAQVAVRKPKSVAHNMFRRQKTKKPSGDEVVSICPPKIYDECFFTAAEKMATAHLNALVSESYSSVKEFDITEEGNPFVNYYERIRSKVDTNYQRCHAAGDVFARRKQQIRELAFTNQKAKTLEAAKGKGKPVADKSIKIEREIYLEAYDSVKSKKDEATVELETLRSLKVAMVRTEIGKDKKCLADLCELRLADLSI